MSAPRISVIMPIYNNARQLRVTLPAILDQNLPDGLEYEVIAIDDGSGPDVAAVLQDLSSPRLRAIRLDENRGRSVARNTGLKHARGEWIVFLDSDMIVRTDFLAAHTAVLGDGADISLGRFTDTDQLAPAEGRPVPPAGLMGFCSNNVALTRAVLDAITVSADGPFDADTFTLYGWEDTDLDVRLSRLKPVRRRATRAISYHHCPPFSPDQLPAMIAKEIERAQMARRFLAKHPTFAVRMVTQATPVHRLAWECLTLFGILNQRSLRPLLAWLVRHERRGLASTLARNLILNPAYVRAL